MATGLYDEPCKTRKRRLYGSATMSNVNLDLNAQLTLRDITRRCHRRPLRPPGVLRGGMPLQHHWSGVNLSLLSR